MRLIKSDTHINFLGQRYFAFALSAILLLVSVGSLIYQGLALDVDFTGGVTVEVGYAQPAELDNVRSALANGGYPDATVQYFGGRSDVMIRLGPQATKDASQVSANILNALQAEAPNVELRRVQFVGSQVGDELINKGGLALLYTLIGILIYVIIRFHWKMAAGSVFALIHDVVITTGFLSLFQIDFDLTVLAALLAIIGYSVNDTIVVFDRERENFRRMRKADTFKIMNVSINEMLARTVMTSMTTILASLALLVFGGDAIFEFALTMTFGVVIGTYSSIYIASAFALYMDITKEDIYPPKEDDDEHAAGIGR